MWGEEVSKYGYQENKNKIRDDLPISSEDVSRKTVVNIFTNK